MALHLIPAGRRAEHQLTAQCPCGPAVERVEHENADRLAVVHRQEPAQPAA